MTTIIQKKVNRFYQSIYLTHQVNSSVRINLVKDIYNDSIAGLDVLLYCLLVRKNQKGWIANYLDGYIYEMLIVQLSSKVQKILLQAFNNGIVLLKSQKNIDYLPLQNFLINKRFKEANTVTYNILRKLSNVCNTNRSWLYFTDISSLPIIDLHTIDNLWRTHSLDKFGFTIQRKIWLSSNRDWNKLWNTIEWQTNYVLCTYPHEFQWSIHGPVGHLPLFNQLYGIQPLLALFKHKAWEYS
uniref:GUN4-like domain-containing protein n=1 Tax=Apophlaea sinclairii TaxID=212746 RepID=A0A1C9CBN0_9FLOR|nr:hypothetical protein Apop_096 [Apophlaea sinclairii]AOM65786.1 hypothetical protein Apop_096 [Apophlaea sinclairii]